MVNFTLLAVFISEAVGNLSEHLGDIATLCLAIYLHVKHSCA